MITGAAQMGFVWASYGVAALVITGLVLWLMFDGKRHATRLADLEARGIKRRSAAD
jgi:heme exporter protein D